MINGFGHILLYSIVTSNGEGHRADGLVTGLGGGIAPQQDLMADKHEWGEPSDISFLLASHLDRISTTGGG